MEAIANELDPEWTLHRRSIARKEEDLARIERQIERLIHQKPSTLRDTKLAKLYQQKRQIR